MPGKSKSACLVRLSRIEGQVRGLSRMLEDERYCIDIITQIAAVRAALKRVEHELLRDHVDHCVREAMQGGTAKDQEQKIKELMSVIARSDDR
jgi:CsoR family transcriptional regulator, copper-sensing transcriptional repressor